MKIYIRSLVFVLVFCIGGYAAHAGGKGAEYSATQIMETAMGRMKAKVYVAPGKKRMETGDSIIITRTDRGVSWTLMPSEQMYIESPLKEGQARSGDVRILRKEKVGTETVSGLRTTKYKTIAVAPDGTRMGGFTWIAGNGIIVRMDMLSKGKGRKMRMKMVLKDIKIGKQAPKLFEIPPGYEKMSMPMGLPFGGRGGWR